MLPNLEKQPSVSSVSGLRKLHLLQKIFFIATIIQMNETYEKRPQSGKL